MKQRILFCAVCLVILGCKQGSTNSAVKTDNSGNSHQTKDVSSKEAALDPTKGICAKYRTKVTDVFAKVPGAQKSVASEAECTAALFEPNDDFAVYVFKGEAPLGWGRKVEDSLDVLNPMATNVMDTSFDSRLDERVGECVLMFQSVKTRNCSSTTAKWDLLNAKSKESAGYATIAECREMLTSQEAWTTVVYYFPPGQMVPCLMPPK